MFVAVVQILIPTALCYPGLLMIHTTNAIPHIQQALLVQRETRVSLADRELGEIKETQGSKVRVDNQEPKDHQDHRLVEGGDSI